MSAMGRDRPQAANVANSGSGIAPANIQTNPRDITVRLCYGPEDQEEGPEAIEQTWASMMRTPGFDLNISPEQIIISSSGDMALDRGTYQLTISAAGSPQTDTGKYVVVWRKVDGVWKAAADIFNSDGPPGEG